MRCAWTAGGWRRRWARLPPRFGVNGSWWRAYRLCVAERARTNVLIVAWACRARFGLPAWRARVAWRGLEELQRARESGRGAILAVLHFGPLGQLGWRLRAEGWDVAILVARSDWLSAKYRRGRGGVRRGPRIFAPGQVGRIRRFLSRGGVLIMAIDFPRGRRVTVPVDDRHIRLGTDAVRLSAVTGTALIPCAITAGWGGALAVTLGREVPRTHIEEPAEHARACRWVLDELLPVLRRHPSQCRDILCEQFEPERNLEPALQAVGVA